MKASRKKKEQESNLIFCMEEKTGDGRIMERQDNRRRVGNFLRRKGYDAISLMKPRIGVSARSLCQADSPNCKARQLDTVETDYQPRYSVTMETVSDLINKP